MVTKWMFCLMCIIFVVDAQEHDRRLLTDNFLLVADENGNRIVQVDAETMTRRLPITVTSQPQVLAYDWLRRDIYWTSGLHRETIFKYSIARNKTVQIHANATTMYSGLAVDVRRHVLYFSDEGQGHVGQLQLKPTTENHFAAEIIDSTAASRPRSVVVDSVNRLLYWCDFRLDELAGLYVFSLNDTTKSRLVPNARVRPRVLAIDFPDQAMYFDDDRSHNFMMLNLSIRNSHPLTLPRVGSVVPYGIAVDSKFVYLSVQHPRVIKKIDRTREVSIEETGTGVLSAHGVAVFIAADVNRTVPPPLLVLSEATTDRSPTDTTELYATTHLMMVIFTSAAATTLLILIVVLTVFTLRRRRRRASVGIASVHSWDASVGLRISGRTHCPPRRPDSAPPPPPRRDTANSNYYDDARGVAMETAAAAADTPAADGDEYLDPVLPPEYQDATDLDGYLQLIDSYQECRY